MKEAAGSGAMMEPLLPAFDAAGQLRETAFALLLRDRRPVDIADLAATTGRPAEGVRDSVTELSNAGWLDVDAEGCIAGAAGLSLVTGPHRLTIGDAGFRTWCAYDALGIAAALQERARVDTSCAVCEAPIGLTFDAGIPQGGSDAQLWLADGGGDLRGSFCAPTVLLCGPAHAAAWGEQQGQRGRLMGLAAAALLGGAEWAGCATAARRLA